MECFEAYVCIKRMFRRIFWIWIHYFLNGSLINRSIFPRISIIINPQSSVEAIFMQKMKFFT